MNTLEGKAWQALAGTRGIGPRALWQIADYLEQQGKTASWLFMNPDKIKDILPGSKARTSGSDFFVQTSKETDKNDVNQVTILHPLHVDFPQRIRILKDRMPLPALLYVQGNAAILSRPAIAIVGKRNPAAKASAAADLLAGELASMGISITSGYAEGIDTIAHLAALRAGSTTSIILAEGIRHFRIKPGFKGLLTTENSLAISQFEPDAQWTGYSAMTRNKLVGALSGALVVIFSGPERDAAGRNSGTYNAGISALKMGIPVFVVAPSFFSDPPAGNRQLIAEGACAWDPASGTAPILAAVGSIHDKKLLRQLELFAKVTSNK